MRNLHWFVRTAVICSVCCAIAASAQERKSGGQWSGEILLANQYVWRGFVEGIRTFELDVTHTRGAWEFCASTEFEMSPRIAAENESRLVEVDLYVTRRVQLKRNWALAVGYDYYGTPNDEQEHGHEFWTGLEYSGPVDFSVKAFQFAAPHTGNYFSAEVGRKLFQRGRFSLRADAALGFNRHMLIEDALFSDAAITLTPSIRVSGGTIMPFVSFSKGLAKEYFNDHFTFGMRLAFGAAED